MNRVKVDKLGLRYPPRLERGTLQTMPHPFYTGNEIKCFCETVKGERVLHPDWGLPNLINEPVIAESEITAIVQSNLKKYFPELKFEVTIENNDNTNLGKRTLIIKYYIDEKFGTIVINLAESL